LKAKTAKENQYTQYIFHEMRFKRRGDIPWEFVIWSIY
jgi:hypothetical protein